MFKHNVTTTPGGIVFASDPLFLSMSAGKNVLYSSGGEEFTFLMSSAGSVNVSDVLEAWANPLPEPSGASWLECVEDWSENCTRRVFMYLPRQLPGTQPRERFSTYVIPGRTSSQNRELLNGSNLFKARLLNELGNPFLSTRTHKGRIILKETELAPLYFLQDNEIAESITLHSPTGIPPVWAESGIELLAGWTRHIGVYTIDLQKARREIFDRHGLLVSEFTIKKGGRVAAEIFIEAADPVKSRHQLRFRNSFGVFEVIELTGELTDGVQFVDVNSFKKFRAEFDRFDDNRRRQELESALTVSTGPKRRRELLHLLDALSSDEVWLLGYGLNPVRVIPEVKSVTVPERQEEPQSMELTLRRVYNEPAVMPEISKSNASYLRKIFTNVFNNQFS
ncbi:hypothetical protein HDR58_01850 [bacterium]|nr:hypothetical protein [bacterium]